MRQRQNLVLLAREWLWVLPPVTAGAGVLLVGLWTGRVAMPDPLGEMQRAIDAQINDEDARFCERLGFRAGTDPHQACQLDLLDVRRSDRELRGSVTF